MTRPTSGEWMVGSGPMRMTAKEALTLSATPREIFDAEIEIRRAMPRECADVLVELVWRKRGHELGGAYCWDEIVGS